MSVSSAQFPFISRDPALGAASFSPLLPLELAGQTSISLNGLLDTGAAVNVLPFAIGQQLGFDWTNRRRLSS